MAAADRERKSMNKTVRIVLYVLSLLTVAGVLAALLWKGAAAPSKGTEAEVMANADTERQAAAEVPVGEDASGTVETPAWEEEAKRQDEVAEIPQSEVPALGEVPETENTEDITLIFTGDVLFANAFLAAYDAGGISAVVADGLKEQLNEADILMVNNEFPFSDRGTPMEGKQYTFRCSPSYVSALTELGVDIVSLANNHTLDYGREALTDTFAALDGAGILYGGAGESAERAEELQIIEVNGKKFGFLAVSRVIPDVSWKVEIAVPGIFSCYDETRLLELVREAKEQCDFVTVFPHWGTEYSEQPNEVQKQIAEKCMEAGADLIVGSHTHCLQGIEYFDGKPVFYSLGNFIFGQSIERSAAVRVTVKQDGSTEIALLPVHAAGGQTSELAGEEAAAVYSYMESISVNAVVDENGAVTERR